MKRLRLRILSIFLLVLSFGLLTTLMLNDKIDSIESTIYDAMAPHITPSLNNAMITFSNLGSFFVITILVAILFLLPFTRIRYGIPIAINVILTAGLNIILKSVIGRERPNILRIIEGSGFGFPSGHAMYNAAFYTMVTLIVFRETKRKRLRFFVLLFSLVMTIAIGVSRVYLGVHVSGDVLAGWMLGAAIAIFVDTAWQYVLME